MTDSPTDLDREIAKLQWALKTKQNVIDRLLREPALTGEEREAVDTAEASLMRESANRNTPEPVRQRFGAAVNTLRGLLERVSEQNPSPSQ